MHAPGVVSFNKNNFVPVAFVKVLQEGIFLPIGDNAPVSQAEIKLNLDLDYNQILN